MGTTLTPAPIAFVNVGSHRAAARLKRALGRPLDMHFVLGRYSGRLAPVYTEAELATARAIPSITRARVALTEPMRCWSTS